MAYPRGRILACGIPTCPGDSNSFLPPSDYFYGFECLSAWSLTVPKPLPHASKPLSVMLEINALVSEFSSGGGPIPLAASALRLVQQSNQPSLYCDKYMYVRLPLAYIDSNEIVMKLGKYLKLAAYSLSRHGLHRFWSCLA